MLPYSEFAIFRISCDVCDAQRLKEEKTPGTNDPVQRPTYCVSLVGNGGVGECVLAQRRSLRQVRIRNVRYLAWQCKLSG